VRKHVGMELPAKQSMLVWPIAVLSTTPIVIGLAGLGLGATLGGYSFLAAPLAGGAAAALLVGIQRSMRPWTPVLGMAGALLTLVFMGLLFTLVVLLLPMLSG
jgi:hypothetical protein